MDVTWYLVLSALLFAVGACGVLLRRSPLVILLCLELMLNAGNLALIAFSRMWGNGDGQIFALVVMVVAACEVVVGLGVIVAMFRRRLNIDVQQDVLTEAFEKLCIEDRATPASQMENPLLDDSEEENRDSAWDIL